MNIREGLRTNGGKQRKPSAKESDKSIDPAEDKMEKKKNPSIDCTDRNLKGGPKEIKGSINGIQSHKDNHVEDLSEIGTFSKRELKEQEKAFKRFEEMRNKSVEEEKGDGLLGD